MKIEELERQVLLDKQKKKRLRYIFISIGGVIFLCILLLTSYYLFFQNKIEKKAPTKEKSAPVIERKLKILNLKSNKRPIAIMIDNNTGVNNHNNHVGLQEAYLTYEIIVEGGLTRIMALYKDKEINLIGPVRSSRHYFLDYALENDALYAHFGFSPYAERDINLLGVNNLNGLYLSEPFFRDNSIAAPHNVFTSIEKLYQAAENKGYRTESDSYLLLNYSFDEINLNQKIKKETENGVIEVENPSLIVANTITIPYSNYQIRSYRYDNNRKVYLRFTNGNVHADKQTKEQLYYKNIIIQKVTNYTLDREGRQDLNTVGTGDGYYVTNGYALPIKWKKEARNTKTVYTDLEGNEIKVNDGNTFIQIQPATYSPEFGG